MEKNKVNLKSKPLLTDKDLEPKNIKSNITIRISLDLLNKYRKEAERLGIGYQTLMQIKLNEAISDPVDQEAPIKKLVRSELAAALEDMGYKKVKTK